MRKLLCAIAGAAALAIAVPAQAATAAPVTAAVFHPDETHATMQTVQYQSHFDARPRHHYRPRPNRRRHYHARRYHRAPPPPPPYRRY